MGVLVGFGNWFHDRKVPPIKLLGLLHIKTTVFSDRSRCSPLKLKPLVVDVQTVFDHRPA